MNSIKIDNYKSEYVPFNRHPRSTSAPVAIYSFDLVSSGGCGNSAASTCRMTVESKIPYHLGTASPYLEVNWEASTCEKLDPDVADVTMFY